MSVVIVGGHDRMVTQYKKICKEYHCKAKVFTHMCANMSLFTNTVSHKMVHCALAEANKGKADVVRCHTSSSSALHEILKNACCSA